MDSWLNPIGGNIVAYLGIGLNSCNRVLNPADFEHKSVGFIFYNLHNAGCRFYIRLLRFCHTK